MTRRSRLVVVGAGPAGLSCAAEASRTGMSVTIVDEGGRLGGQYFRDRRDSAEGGSPRMFLREFQGMHLANTVAFDLPAEGIISVWNEQLGVIRLRYDALVLATGAHDRPVALPGWTLPGVLTVGGGLVLARANAFPSGYRAIVAGAHPSLLVLADELAARGLEVDIVEANTVWDLTGVLRIIVRDPGSMFQALRVAGRLASRGVGRMSGCMVTSIIGKERVEGVAVSRVDKEWRRIPGSERTTKADLVFLGFGFVPNLELAQMLGCSIQYSVDARSFHVRTDHGMRTSKRNVYAAGEVTCIGGARLASIEGRIAGMTAAFDAGLLSKETYGEGTRKLGSRLTRARHLAEWMRRTYRPRDGLWSLAGPSTILCRCEGTTIAEAQTALEANASTPFAVKTATHAGMGLCQGRICGSYLIEWLRAQHGYLVPREGWPWRVRPPLFPIPLGDWLLLDGASDNSARV